VDSVTSTSRDSTTSGQQRALSALPDALTASAYAFTWVAPLAISTNMVKILMLGMIMEFLLLHSGAFIGFIVLRPTVPKLVKSVVILGLGALYLRFVLGFSAALDSWWPVWNFLWLLFAKFALVWIVPQPAAAEAKRTIKLWGFSVVVFFAAMFVTTFVPIPRFGITEKVLSAIALPGSGLWISDPQTVVVSGMVYFSLVAFGKWKVF